ncbi:MAG: hypothetical protein U0230_09355 [Polyangiales bacterium]
MHEIHRRILEINSARSALFVADEPARTRYRARHPTYLGAVKCMDGRVLFPVLTKTPLGIVYPYRAIGGRPEVWWPSFLGRVRAFVEQAMRDGQRAVAFLTYHHSESDPHLGCAGWEFHTDAARAHADRLAADLSGVFGDALVPIVANVETDRDVLTLHGPSGDVSGEAVIGLDDDGISAAIGGAFPTIDPGVRRDLVPLLRGNALRVEELRGEPKDLDAKAHHERILAVGQGFDWLYQENLALIINDADPGLAASIAVAAAILRKNLESAPADEEFTILTCVPYQAPGIDHRQAVARARGLRDFASEVVRRSEPELASCPRFHALAGVVWAPAKRFEPIL